jgi:hypothetical protein
VTVALPKSPGSLTHCFAICQTTGSAGGDPPSRRLSQGLLLAIRVALNTVRMGVTARRRTMIQTKGGLRQRCRLMLPRGWPSGSGERNASVNSRFPSPLPVLPSNAQRRPERCSHRSRSRLLTVKLCCRFPPLSPLPLPPGPPSLVGRQSGHGAKRNGRCNHLLVLRISVSI